MGARSRISFVALVALTIAVASPADALAQRRRARRAPPSGSAAPAAPSGETASVPVDPHLDAEARALFLAGETAYDAGRYEAALEYFTRAHALSGRPGLLFNIASASERLRRDGEALAAYEQYLAELPEASNRAFTEERIAFLREQLARDAELREAAARAAHVPRLPEPRRDPHPELPLDEDEPPPDPGAPQAATLPSGAPRAALLEVEEIPIPPPAIPSAALDPAPAGEGGDEGEDLVEQWWFWTLVGVAVVGAGVGVGAAIAAATDGGQVGGSAPVTGDFGPGGVIVALEAF